MISIVVGNNRYNTCPDVECANHYTFFTWHDPATYEPIRTNESYYAFRV